MPQWIYYALATVMALATADVAVKMAAGKISNSLAMLIYGSCVFLISLSWVMYQYFNGQPFHADRQGVIFALVVGVAFCCVTIGLYVTFAAGAPISLASPMIRLGGLMIASAIGLMVFREPFNLRYAVGMALAIAGVYLIVTR